METVTLTEEQLKALKKAARYRSLTHWSTTKPHNSIRTQEHILFLKTWNKLKGELINIRAARVFPFIYGENTGPWACGNYDPAVRKKEIQTAVVVGVTETAHPVCLLHGVLVVPMFNFCLVPIPGKTFPRYILHYNVREDISDHKLWLTYSEKVRTILDDAVAEQNRINPHSHPEYNSRHIVDAW
jgi:hypothetical protein